MITRDRQCLATWRLQTSPTLYETDTPGRHKLSLPTPIDRELFLDIVQLVETPKLHESKIQAKIDQLSATYYYVSCDIKGYNIRKGILALEKEKIQASQRDKCIPIQDNFTPSPNIARRLSVP